mgnify:FL=1
MRKGGVGSVLSPGGEDHAAGERMIAELPASWAFLRVRMHFVSADDRPDPLDAHDYPANRLDLVIAEPTSCAGLMCPERSEMCDTCEHHLPGNIFL